jgi:C4-dicarboxylate transporter DctM subunit
MIIFSIFLIIIVILAIGVPVGIGLGISGILLSMYLEGTKTLISIPQTIFSSGNSFLLSAIPLFILMSEILKKANIIQILFDTVNKFVGNLRGGLAITTIITSAIGASITGSSVANAASMCIVAADPMIKMGYKRNFTYGLIAVSGTLGILIPPSIPMLLFASVTNESVGKLFLAGIIPGLVLTFILCLYVIIFPNLKSKSKKLIINYTFAEKILSIKKRVYKFINSV